MGVDDHITSVGGDKHTSRLGCSICLKKNTSNNLIVNSSINKLCLANKNLGVIERKKKKCQHSIFCEKCKITPECYCNHMEHIKEELLPKLICSKRYSSINRNDKEEDWFNDIMSFRRENWFDCHSNVINATRIKDTNYLYFFNNDSLNGNNSILSKHTEYYNKSNTEIPCIIYLEKPNTMVKCLQERKKTIQKSGGKTKKNSNSVYKPWIPPSTSYNI